MERYREPVCFAVGEENFFFIRARLGFIAGEMIWFMARVFHDTHERNLDAVLLQDSRGSAHLSGRAVDHDEPRHTPFRVREP